MSAVTQTRQAAGWRVEFGFNSMVDFCVWVLEREGLRLAPFDRHRAGDGPLRSMGMAPSLWQAWLDATVTQQIEPEALRTAFGHAWPGTPLTLQPDADPCVSRRFDPSALWPGQPALRPWLAELWRQYGPLALVRRAQVERLERSLIELWLQDALAEFSSYLPSLHIHLVRYPHRVVYLAQPQSLVLGIDDGHWDCAALWPTVRDAVGELVTAED